MSWRKGYPVRKLSISNRELSIKENVLVSCGAARGGGEG